MGNGVCEKCHIKLVNPGVSIRLMGHTFSLSYRSRLYTCSPLCVGNRYVTACRYIARVVEVEQDKGEVLVHFERWNSRYDEYIKMSSKRLRVLLPERKAMLQRERDRQHSKVGGV